VTGPKGSDGRKGDRGVPGDKGQRGITGTTLCSQILLIP